MLSKPVKVAFELVKRYKTIRAVYTCYYTQLGSKVQDFSNEFFFLVGDIIEGKPIDETRLRHIDMKRVREFLKEDR